MTKPCFATAKQMASASCPDFLLADPTSGFDTKSDSAFVRQPVVEALFGVSAATVWRMVRRKQLPAPKKLSDRVTAWNVGELRAVLNGGAAK